MKLRQNLYLDSRNCDALEALARKPGVNKSRLVDEAITFWLAHRAASEVDALLKPRLNAISRDIARIELIARVTFEGLMLLVRYVLAVLPPLAEGDKASLAAGKERFERFIAQLGRELEAGGTSIIPPAAKEPPR